MRIKFKNLIIYLSLLIFIGFFLVSCGKKSNIIDENNIYIESFEYEVVENDSSVDKELSYSLSFDIGFSFKENVRPEEIIVRIEGKKSFQFTMDYCNTENITLSQSSDKYPYALLNYTVPQDVNSMESNVKIKITTTDLMDDINKFLTINCSSDDFIFIDDNNFTLDGYFKMNYSSDTGIYYEYNEFSESYKIVSVITKSKTLELPSIYNNHPVKTIDKNAFTSVTEVEELILPDTLTSIPEGLLSGMSKLKSLTIPYVGSSLNETDNTHFGYIFGASSYEDNSKCVPNSLKEIIIKEGTSIGDYAFRDCSGLTSIFIPNSVTSIGDYTFSNCSSLKDITIPSSIISIGLKAFENCSSLTSITIPDSLKNIGLQTFSGCSNIKKATIPAIVVPSISRDVLQELIITSGTSIKNNGYSSWPSLESIIIPDTITSIESGTFSSCENLIKATMPTTAISYIPNSKLQEIVIIGGENISKEAFQNCNNLLSVVIGESVTNIEDNAFGFCYNLTSLTIGQNVKTIDSSAFYRCFKLVEVYNLSNLAITKGSRDNGYVGYYAKVIHTSLKEKNSLIEKDNYIFVKDEENKYYLVKYNGTEIGLILPDNIEGSNYGINQYAFYKCNSLISVLIPNSVTSIGDRAFEDCSGITSITIPFVGASLDGTSSTRFDYIFGVSLPSSLKEVIITGGQIIGERAFYACENITSITMPESITTIEAYAFFGCSKLTSIIIPNSVTKIDSYAFSGCSYNLKYNEYDNGLYLGNKINPYLCLVKAKDTAITSCKISDSTKFIHSSAFSSCDSLTSITIPESVTSIGEYAFSDCYNLKNVSIPAFALSYIPKDMLQEIIITSGTTIESNSFEYCNNIKKIEIPETITSIKKDVFSDCNNLEFNEYDNGLYLGNSSNPYICLVKTKDTSITTCTINENTKFIYASAFDYCSNLEFNEYDNGLYLGNSSNPYLCLIKASSTSCTINENTKFIYTSAFEFCSSITSITIPESVTSIGDYAFSRCSNLESIIISNNVTSIGEYAFYNCTNLTSVTIGSGVTSIEATSFFGCHRLVEVYNLSNLTITKESMDGVKIIHTSLEEKSSLIEKDDYVFVKDEEDKYYLVKYNGKQTNLILPDNIDGYHYEINQYCFYNSNSLTSVTIGNSVESIGRSAFSGCRSITSITIPESVVNIGDAAFYECSNLKSITIPNNVTSIGEFTFNECMNLESVTIGSSVTSIENSVFFYCNSLVSITIPDSVTSICHSAFYACSKLESITISNSVTYIGIQAFYGCDNLKEVYYKGSIEDWNKVDIDSNNNCLITTEIYYYSEAKPTEEGNYWHYVNGVVTKW